MCALVLRNIGYRRRLHNPILLLRYLTLFDGSSHVNNPQKCCSTQLLCEGQSAPRLTPFVISFSVFTHDAPPALLGRQPLPSYTSHAQLRSEPTEEVVGSPPEVTATPSASAAIRLCCACHGSHRTVHVLSAQFVTQQAVQLAGHISRRHGSWQSTAPSVAQPSPEGGVPAPGGDEVHEQRDDEHAQAADHDGGHPDPGGPPPVRHL